MSLSLGVGFGGPNNRVYGGGGEWALLE